ncbi:hypothetical protein [Phenylobacterium sp.]|uniref:hypothetical protein n=1 Tax=Phenylobacterium sp. TaxID=1871053 RepID=UPI002715F709|nr:hypothetical protein [Phenylobacterium sp.]MDO8379246.1 hypothetical protein [Phenylobacterium sp.]
MIGRSVSLAALAALVLAAQASAQAVEVAPLAAPDFFSTGARETGLAPDLWRGASGQTMRTVLPLLAAKPLSPAAQALARRILATGAAGPDDAGRDAAVAGARVGALIAQGGVKDAAAILSRTAGLDQNPVLAQAGAEAALLSGDDDGACAISDKLTAGREDAYWLRLRAYCQLKAGNSGVAQLTFDLAQSQARDPVYGRLMGAKLAGGGDPGAPALRNGLDYALTRNLGLPVNGPASPAVAAALAANPTGPAIWSIEGGPGPVKAAMAALAAGDLATVQTMRAGLTGDTIPGATITDLALLDAMISAASGKADPQTLDRLIERGAVADPKTRARAQQAALLLAALGAPMSPQARGQFAGFTAAEAKAPATRAFALDLAGAEKLPGETALLALWISADAGAGGPAAGDRARIVRALKAAGLEEDARAFAVEGLLAVR